MMINLGCYDVAIGQSFNDRAKGGKRKSATSPPDEADSGSSTSERLESSFLNI